MAFNPTPGYPPQFHAGAVDGARVPSYVSRFARIPVYARSSVTVGATVFNAFLVKVGKFPRILEFHEPSIG